MDPEPDIPTIAVTSPSFQTGTVLGGRYRVEARLGRGGMGEVWRAYDLKLCVDVALKTLHPERLTDGALRDLIRREVRLAREVHSPNVCRIFDLIEAADQELLSMEYVDGATLLDVVRRRGPISPGEAGGIAAQLLAGLEAIHAAGLVHRDLKPENVMITRSGRVVIMDLGIARSIKDSPTGTIAGTPGYMAPEQTRGEAVDARVDVYSAGIVLAELVDPNTPFNGDRLASFLRSIRESPSLLGETPWKPVLQKALAWDRQERYPSAAALARALESATQRFTGSGERRPYPGLASFSTADAPSFFGRELEVESLWRKLARQQLLAIVGPSGTGKSSFLHAGLLPAQPEGWSSLVCTPGVSPFVALGQALASQLEGDRDVLRDFLRFQEPDVATSLFTRWRQRHSQALLVLDQFEELFTLNPPEIQKAFAELLGRLSLEADVHVLLSMRDDFLLRCQAHSAFLPIFSDLTPLGPLRGPDLRRAITLPAIGAGFRFEDNALADEMVAQVSTERGALPLLAFAAARLWDLRDRERGLLTREAYARIGGVAGALAQHAEITYERIPAVRQPLVREIFRNLVTAERTRLVRERDDLLSIFEDRAAASQVLGELVDARLLTTFEVAGAEDGHPPRIRIEVIHESLLDAWPRLLHWQTQDAEGAQLRDQLRQAAQLWRDRGRAPDLLWTGTLYREFELWRERNPDRLSEMEEEYAIQMGGRARRRRRRKRALVTGVIVALVGVLAVVTTLWRQSEMAAQRAEASKLSTLAQVAPRPEHGLAYAIASLELSDEPEVRREAIRILWKGPIAFEFSPIYDFLRLSPMGLSPDLRWLAIGVNLQRSVRLFPLRGDHERSIKVPTTGLPRFTSLAISADSRTLATAGEDGTVYVGSPSDSIMTRTMSFSEHTWIGFSHALGCYLVRESPPGERPRWTALSPDGLVRHDLGEAGLWDPARRPPAMDPKGARIAQLVGSNVYELDTATLKTDPLRFVGSHPHAARIAAYSPGGLALATADDSGDVRIWPLQTRSTRSPLVLHGGSRPSGAAFDPQGDRLAMGFFDGLRLWDLRVPEWRGTTSVNPEDWVCTPAFHPSGQWAVATTINSGAFAWPLSRKHAQLIHHAAGWASSAEFSPDGQWLLTTDRGTIRLWPLSGPPDAKPSDLFQMRGVSFFSLEFAASGKVVFARGETLVGDQSGGAEAGLLAAIPLDGSPAQIFRDPPVDGTISVDPTGRFVSSTCAEGEAVFDLRTGRSRVVRVNGTFAEGLGFAADGRLILYSKGYYLYDPVTEAVESLPLDPIDLFVTKPGVYVWRDASGQWFHGDPVTGRFKSIDIQTDEREIFSADFDSNRLALGYGDGSVEVYEPGARIPHLLLAHRSRVGRVSVDPKGRFIASGGTGGAYLWPMPTGVALQSLPREEFLAKLRSLTNYRARPDSSSISGYSIKAEPFPGWYPVPTW